MQTKRVLEQLLADSDCRNGAFKASGLTFEKRVAQLSPEATDIKGLRIAFECLQGDEEATRRLKRTLETIADTLGPRIVQDDDMKGEICQQTYVLLLYGGSRCERGYLLTYEGRAQFEVWLRTALIRHSIAVKRRQKRELPFEVAMERLTSEGAAASPELLLTKRRYATEFRTAFRSSIAALPAQDRLVLRYHLVDRLKAEEIARLFRVHRVTVARWMRRIRLALLEQTRVQLGDLLNDRVDDLNSVFRLVESQIDVSFSGLPQDFAT